MCAVYCMSLLLYTWKHIMILPCKRHCNERSEKSDMTYPIRQVEVTQHHILLLNGMTIPWLSHWPKIVQQSLWLLRHKCTIHVLIPAKSMETWVFGLYLGQNWTKSHDSSCKMKLFDILNKMKWSNIDIQRARVIINMRPNCNMVK